MIHCRGVTNGHFVMHQYGSSALVVWRSKASPEAVVGEIEFSARSGWCAEFPFSGSSLRGLMMDGKQLRALFKQFNVKYWGGKLPPYSIRVVARISSTTQWSM